MFLLGKGQFRGKPITHYLGGNQFPKKIEPEQLEQLVIKLKNGDETVIDEIVKGHIRLAISIASKYYHKLPLLVPDDIVSEAVCGILYAVKKAKQELEDNNIAAWITVAIHRFIHQFIMRDWLIIQKDRDYEHAPKIVSLDSNTSTPLFKQRRNFLKTRLSSTTNRNVDNIMDLINLAIEREPDRRRKELKKYIIYLRSLSYDDLEIANMLKISRSYVNLLRNEVEQIYDQLMKRSE